MATTNFRLLASLLLATLTVGTTACGSTVTGGEDDGDDGTEDGSSGTSSGCDPTFVGDCEHGGASCVNGAWICPPAPGCPADRPLPGAFCPFEQSCSYPEEGFCGDQGEVTFHCEDQAWSEPAFPRCSPPQEECPVEQPPIGSACAMENQICQYDGGECGFEIPTYLCEGGVWTTTEGTTNRCSQILCTDVSDADDCNQWGCRWLIPGCGDDVLISLPEAGCFDPEPCGEESCFGDEMCTEVMILPDCVDEGCDACGQSDFVCLQLLVGGEP